MNEYAMLMHDLGIGLIGLIGQGKDNEPVLLLGWSHSYHSSCCSGVPPSWGSFGGERKNWSQDFLSAS